MDGGTTKVPRPVGAYEKPPGDESLGGLPKVVSRNYEHFRQDSQENQDQFPKLVEEARARALTSGNQRLAAGLECALIQAKLREGGSS